MFKFHSNLNITGKWLEECEPIDFFKHPLVKKHKTMEGEAKKVFSLG